MSGGKFLRSFARVSGGWPGEWKCAFCLTRDGKPVKIQRTIFSECFYIMAMDELSRVTNDVDMQVCIKKEDIRTEWWMKTSFYLSAHVDLESWNLARSHFWKPAFTLSCTRIRVHIESLSVFPFGKGTTNLEIVETIYGYATLFAVHILPSSPCPSNENLSVQDGYEK